MWLDYLREEHRWRMTKVTLVTIASRYPSAPRSPLTLPETKEIRSELDFGEQAANLVEVCAGCPGADALREKFSHHPFRDRAHAFVSSETIISRDCLHGR